MRNFPVNNKRLLDTFDLPGGLDALEEVRHFVNKVQDKARKGEQGVVTAYLNRYQTAVGAILEQEGFLRTPYFVSEQHPESGSAIYYYPVNPKRSIGIPGNEEYQDVFEQLLQ